MDILYTFRYDKHSLDNQLKYSLRSVGKHLAGVNDVFVMGWSSSQCDGTIHLRREDRFGPARNIMTKLQSFAEIETLGEDFLHSADDHFLLSNQHIDTFPVYSNGTLPDLINSLRNTYKVILRNTVKALEAAGKPLINYNVHAPCIYNKEKLKELAKMYNLNDELGYVAKSLYFNTFPPDKSVEIKDCKIRSNIPLEDMRARIEGRSVFSTGKEHLCPNIQILLDELYPKPSRWETQF